MRLSIKHLPKQFKGLTKKRHFSLKLIPKEGVRAWDTQWGGGTKNDYFLCELSEGHEYKYREPADDGEYMKPIHPGQVLIEYSVSMGRDMAPTFHVQPHHLEAFGVTAAQVLFAEPAPAPEQDLLNVARCFPLAQLHDYLLDHGSKLAEKTAKYLE